MENGKIVTWQDLPMRFKVDVATLLDRDSRLAFQLTSRAENDIVSRCPINLKSLSISSFYCEERCRRNCRIEEGTVPEVWYPCDRN
ncbi:hypothetical protein L3Y34_006927 [Caenorhabditis briggsae]|uniref:Uncharacterized protein n=1 Tax=Caenorhabditis briggsae TaxID=6238 RepID=A0AAE8ZXJ3_CAEBR|nr:hypothetical protein L3Y34_006927 [Caenorhabditis briggsae]